LNFCDQNARNYKHLTHFCSYATVSLCISFVTLTRDNCNFLKGLYPGCRSSSKKFHLRFYFHL